MTFSEILQSAKQHDAQAKNQIFEIYRTLLIKNALVRGQFDEDLYQELQEVLLKVIKTFEVKKF